MGDDHVLRMGRLGAAATVDRSKKTASIHRIREDVASVRIGANPKQRIMTKEDERESKDTFHHHPVRPARQESCHGGRRAGYARPGGSEVVRKEVAPPL